MYYDVILAMRRELGRFVTARCIELTHLIIINRFFFIWEEVNRRQPLEALRLEADLTWVCTLIGTVCLACCSVVAWHIRYVEIAVKLRCRSMHHASGPYGPRVLLL